VLALKIGRLERTYQLYETNAPENYDGFGTMGIYSGGENRFVLIDVKHLEWQVQRYRSGIFKADKSDIPIEWAEQILIDKIFTDVQGSS
jgi:hypothetical protein